MPSPQSEPVTSPEDCDRGRDFLQAYNGSHGHDTPCTREQWPEIRPSLLEALVPIGHFSPRGIRRYANAYARLAAWAIERGLPMVPGVLLSAEVQEAFLVQQPAHTADLRSILRGLARANGVEIAETPLGYTKRQAPAPYSVEECESLLDYASAMTNRNRRTSLQALLALGLGAGLARTSLRGVGAASVHLHGGESFVRSGVHCAKVRHEHVALLAQVCAERPEGDLIAPSGHNITTEIVATATGRVGVPHLNTDRLRATYICRSLGEGASLADLMSWTGSRAGTLDGYLKYLSMAPRQCPLGSPDEGGAK